MNNKTMNKKKKNQVYFNKIPQVITILKKGGYYPASRLSGLLNITERELRLLIHYIRCNVSPRIISNELGYKWEKSDEVIMQNLKRWKRLAYSLLKMSKQVRKMLIEEKRR